MKMSFLFYLITWQARVLVLTVVNQTLFIPFGTWLYEYIIRFGGKAQKNWCVIQFLMFDYWNLKHVFFTCHWYLT